MADALAFIHLRGHSHGRVLADSVRVELSRTGPMRIKLMAPILGVLADHERIDRRSLPPETRLRDVDPVCCDLYALGVLVYQAAIGTLPFRGETETELFEAKQAPVDLHALRPAIPVPLSHLVRDLLNPDPAGRPTSAVEVLGRVGELAEAVTYVDAEVLRAPELVGRATELRTIRQGYERCCSSSAVTMVLAGAAGQGTTRLMNEALVDLRLEGAMVTRSRGRGFGDVPFAALRELLAPLLRTRSAGDALDAADTGALLRSLLAWDHAMENTPPAGALHRALLRYLVHMTRGTPVIAAVDDIHLTDDGSIEALAAVVTSTARLR
ncbi:MAG: AAA family ATPase, partial [Myxococcota bacterium]